MISNSLTITGNDSEITRKKSPAPLTSCQGLPSALYFLPLLTTVTRRCPMRLCQVARRSMLFPVLTRSAPVRISTVRCGHRAPAATSARLRSSVPLTSPEIYPPAQKATGVNPWMNARWVPSRSLGEGGCASEGSARRSVWRGITAVRLCGSTSINTVGKPMRSVRARLIDGAGHRTR